MGKTAQWIIDARKTKKETGKGATIIHNITIHKNQDGRWRHDRKYLATRRALNRSMRNQADRA